MVRLFICLCIMVALLGAACSKSTSSEESALYGTWVKGNQVGDTLYFLRKDGKNILRSNQSFNPSLTAWTEWEYYFKNGQLSIALGAGTQYRLLDSFSWVETNKKFDILGYQLFLFMSSSVTHFVYTRVN